MKEAISAAAFRIGVDVGGTKIEAAAIDRQGEIRVRRRVATPAGDYPGSIAAIAGLVAAIEGELAIVGASVGIGIPGAIAATGLVKNANSTWLIGRPFSRDVEATLGREVRFANDANCFALSEAVDGAAAGCATVFGAILGTGCGGGLVLDGKPVLGRSGIAGEWGHSPFPWAAGDTIPGRRCWCGELDCIETVVSGRALAVDCDGPGAKDATSVVARAESGDARAQAALERHLHRLARALSSIVNMLDPDAIVLGGGLSKMDHLYEGLPRLLQDLVFNHATTPIIRPKHGDSSGVRGAAWLWPG
jgi:fructokinase